jgi:hypothetical protein
MVLQLFGSITTGESFAIIADQTFYSAVGPPIDVYLLVLPTGPSGPVGVNYTLSSLSNTGATASQIGEFSVSGTDSAMVISDSNNGGYLGFDKNNRLVNSPTPVTFAIVQSNSATAPHGNHQGTGPVYQEWNPPDIFLTNVYYYIQLQNGDYPYVDLIDNNNNLHNDLIFAFQVLPSSWYTNCVNGTYIGITAQTTVPAWSCQSVPTLPWCSAPPGVPSIPNGWTTMADCQAGIEYPYCATGTYCGTSSCNGPCKATYDNCDNISGSSFTCVIDPSKYFTETKWWESGIFIGIVSFFGIMILVILVFIFVVAKKKIQKAGESDDNPVQEPKIANPTE